MSEAKHNVVITEDGRAGQVRYREPEGELAFHWEFGGRDVVAIVQAGREDEWRTRHPWAADRRTQILRFVADEVVRQKLPKCRAEIDEGTGDILLRQAAPGPLPLDRPDVSFVRRLTGFKAVLGLIVLVASLIFAGVWWLKDKVLSIDPGDASPVGLAARTDRHIAMLMSRLDAYVPSPHRDHGKDTYSLSLFIVPLDGADPKLVPIKHGLSPSSYSLAKVIGSDGRAIWFDAAGMGAVDLKTFDLLAPSELRDPPKAERTSALPFGPKVEHHLAAGLFTSPTSWLGLHSTAGSERDLKPGAFVKRVVRADGTKEERHLFRALVDAEAFGDRHRIASVQQLNDAGYINAAFIRMDDLSEPFLLADPPGALMVYTSGPGLKGTLVAARVDLDGNVLWKADTGIDRFTLKQILPGEGSTAFMGTRPMVPDQVSEPLLVIVEHATGQARTITLWQ